MREDNTVYVDTYEEFKQALDDGKFVMAHRDGTPETEALIKEECKAVTRCIPSAHFFPVKGLNSNEERGGGEAGGFCVKTGKPSQQRVLFARSY